MKLHALVEDVETARAAVDGGATVVQLRLKGAATESVVERGAPFRELGATFVVNDDVEAAVRLGADGVHLGRSDAAPSARSTRGSCSASPRRRVEEARGAERRGAAYIGAGPVWATPSKADADPPIGLDGLREICAAVAVPVVAIGGIDASNAADCIRAGAAGVAVIRAAADAQRCGRRSMRLSELGELGLLAELERRGLAQGIEDDAAELDGGLVVTQDALVEDVHFRLDWTTWRDLGYKAAAVNLSDLAASGAAPEALLVTLGAPAETDVDDVLELYAGLPSPACRSSAATRRAPRRSSSPSPRSAAPSASPAAAAQARATCSSSPARSAPPGGLPPRASREAAAAPGRGPPPGRGRDCAHRHLRRSRRRRRPHRGAVRLPPRDRPRGRPARRGRDAARTSASERTTSSSPRRPTRSASR